MKNRIVLCIGLVFTLNSIFAQYSKAPDNWFNLDPKSDQVNGVSTEKMYRSLLKGRSSETVVVAVIDGGVDPLHEDLIDVMWINEDEIPDNGIDDDKNGYVDDIYGWNFIGGKNGNVHHDQLEITRVYKSMIPKYKDADPSKLSKKEKKKYEEFQKMKKKIEKEIKSAKEGYDDYFSAYENFKLGEDIIKKYLGKDEVTAEDLKTIKSDDFTVNQAVTVLDFIYSQGLTGRDLKDGADYYESKAKYYYNVDFDGRSIVGDNYNDTYEKYYGNNDVKGPDAFHGTFCAGIIGAARGNELGMDGVADNVRIMAIRAVPNGDERDKDVANAIRYAVDNGASIINMSFGKGYAWDKKAVDKAVKYAMKKDVLLVHAAGNSSNNTDEEPNFPNDKFEKAGWFKPKKAKNWIEVGALSWKSGAESPADFSNYAAGNVDLFAPGVDIYSTEEDNKYGSHDGTSFAAPVVSGMAAVLRSYFPSLTAVQIKEIIMSTVVPQNTQVNRPGSEEKVSFKDLCVTGGVANAYNAVQKAMKTKGKKKIKKKKKVMEVIP